MAGDWDFSGIVIPSAAEDLYCTAGISVYAPRENDVLVLPHIRRRTFCNKDFRATLEMTMRAKRYQNSAALLIFMRRTTIPNSSFLIPHSRKAFIHNQWAEPPKELTLNPLNL